MAGPVAVQGLFPILVSPDLPGLLRFWVDGLGARQTYQFPEEGAAVFVGLDLAGQHLGLGLAAKVDGHGPVSLWLDVPDRDGARPVGNGAGPRPARDRRLTAGPPRPGSRRTG